MSETLIASLQKRIDELTGENASLKAENKDRRIKAKKGSEELDDLRKQVETLAAERDTFKTKAEASPGEHAAKIAELEGQIRQRDHRDAFSSVKEFESGGKKYTLHPKASIDAVWKQIGYTPEGETPDGKAVAEQFGRALEAHPYLFAEADAAGAAQRPTTVQSREAGPGAGKGSSSATVTAAAGSQVVSTAGGIPGRI